MKRKDFLKTTGALIAASAIPKTNLSAENIQEKQVERLMSKLKTPPPVCTLVPTETSGPYPLDLSGTSTYWRSNIKEDRTGVDLNLTLQINGVNNCGVMQTYRVDVWHCSAEGYYSGYTTTGHNGSQNNGSARWLRGIQATGSNGQVSFLTRFPGWYSGRVCHIHFQVFSGGVVGSSTGWVSQKITQLTFPITEKNTLLTSNSPYSTWGADPILPQNDNVFSDGYSLQLASLDGAAAPYSSFLEVAIPGTGSLPLEFLGISGALKGQNAMIWWRTANEHNFSHFDLEYSPDGEDFEFVARIAARGNELSQVNDYSYEDHDRLVLGNAFYRLRMVDFDGSEQFSSMVVVVNEHRTPIRIYPNPASDHLILSHGLLQGNEKVMLMDSECREIAIGDLSENTEFTRINLDLCKTGFNYIVFFDGSDAQVLKFLVNK